MSLYCYLAGSLAVVIAVAAVHPENSGDITVHCERGSCAAGIIAFGPVLSKLRMATALSPLSFLNPAAIDSKQSRSIGPTLQINIA